MIPDVPDLNDALKSLTVGAYSELPQGQAAIACEAVNRVDEQGPTDQRSKLGIAYYRSTKVSLDALITRVEKELAGNEHVLFDVEFRRKKAIATKVLGLAVACSSSPEQVRQSLGAIIASISGCQLNQFAILKLPPEDNDVVTFGDFSFGRLNVHRLEYVCQHAGSDYFQRYGSNLTNCTAAMRIVKDLRLLDLKGSHLSLREYKPAQSTLIDQLSDEYHHDLAQEYWDRFRFEMVRQQALMTAAGVGGVSPTVFWQLQRMTMFVAVFNRDLPDRGWVAPHSTAILFTRTRPSIIAKARAEVSALLNVTDWGSSRLDDSIQLYCDYLTAAAEHEVEGRTEEALLHSVFALDLLLGGKAEEALTAVLAERAGLLCNHPLEMKLEDAVRFIRDTYDMRSGYAHRGERGKLTAARSGMTLRERYELLRKCCRAILFAACWARKQPWCKDRDSWLDRIDLLRAHYKAGVTATEQIAELGLDRIHASGVSLPGFVIDWDQPE